MVYSAAMVAHSVYLHIPFCRYRCGYCDFNTYAGMEGLMDAYVEALCREIDQAARNDSKRVPVGTIFFGGGTPSLLPVPLLERIIAQIQSSFNLLPDLEVTLEANPGTLSPAYLSSLHSLGVNRISLGVQSANPQELRLLDRQHDHEDVIRSVAWARKAGFTNLNLDLIFGLPEQSLESWQRSLDLALQLSPDHFSLYALTLEHGTPMGHWADRGLIPLPDPDLAADMYEWASDRLEGAGYAQYEISNWGRIGPDGEPLACRHNLQYWRNLPYFGFGAGAHGYISGVRTANVLAPAAYIRRCMGADGQVYPRTAATQSAEEIDLRAEIGETMMMGLRLTREGVSNKAFTRRFGRRLEEQFPQEIDALIKAGLLAWAEEDGDRLRLTRKGRLLGNQVFLRFI